MTSGTAAWKAAEAALLAPWHNPVVSGPGEASLDGSGDTAGAGSGDGSGVQR